MQRHLVASGATAIALCLGAGGALAADPVAPVEVAVPIAPAHPPQEPPLLAFLAELLGIDPPPPGVAASATASSSGGQGAAVDQVVPVAGAVAVSSPANADLPVGVAGGPGGAGGAAVQQLSTSQATAVAANDVTTQSVTPAEGDGAGGGAAQSSTNGQAVPVAVGAAVSAPVNLNVPVGVLSIRPTGDVTQTGESSADALALNNRARQAITSGVAGGAAAQSADNAQTVPIALGLALAAPVNANLPIDILSGDGLDLLSGPPDATLEGVLRAILAIAGQPDGVGGSVAQRSTSQATAIAGNSAVEQSIAGGGTPAQSGASGQLVPAAVGAALSLPLNGNLPIGVLQDRDGAAGDPVTQDGAARAQAEAVNFDLTQDAEQGGEGAPTASQASENDQLLPIAISTDLAAPINLSVPVSVLGRSLGDGAVDLSIVQRVLDAVDATVADPAGTIRHILEDPEATIEGLVRG